MPAALNLLLQPGNMGSPAPAGSAAGRPGPAGGAPAAGDFKASLKEAHAGRTAGRTGREQTAVNAERRPNERQADRGLPEPDLPGNGAGDPAEPAAASPRAESVGPQDAAEILIAAGGHESGSPVLAAAAGAATTPEESAPWKAVAFGNQKGPAPAVPGGPGGREAAVEEGRLPGRETPAVGGGFQPEEAKGHGAGLKASRAAVSPERLGDPAGGAGLEKPAAEAGDQLVKTAPGPSPVAAADRGVEAPTPGAERPAGPPAGNPPVVVQVAHRAFYLTRRGRSEAQLKLSPESLGHLHLRIATENHQVTVRVAAELSHTKELLEQNLQQLKTSLQQFGLEVEEIEVSVLADENRKDKDTDLHRASPRRFTAMAAQGRQFAEEPPAGGRMGGGRLRCLVDTFA